MRFSLKELDDFIKEKDKALANTINDGDYNGLVKRIKHLNQIQEKIPIHDNMFDPIKIKIELLKKYSNYIYGMYSIFLSRLNIILKFNNNQFLTSAKILRKRKNSVIYRSYDHLLLY